MSKLLNVNRRTFLQMAGASGLLVTGALIPVQGVEAAMLPSPNVTTSAIKPLLEEVPLPEPRLSGTMTLEDVLRSRRSQRRFADSALTMGQIGQLLWAAQGITDPSGKRTAPSAGSAYPMEVYLAWPEGYARYSPAGHSLLILGRDDARAAFPAATAAAPAIFVIAGVAELLARFRAQADRFMHLEAGHIAQNILLQAVALGLVGVPQGSVSEDKLRAAMGIPAGRTILYQVPIGIQAV
jgi:SagB-type dehydrogenase family enzyme